MSKKSVRDPIREGLEEMLMALVQDWRENPETWSRADMLKTVQFGGGYLVRKISTDESEQSGSTVRKYAGAFKTNVAPSRAARGRSTPAYTLDAESDADEAA